MMELRALSTRRRQLVEMIAAEKTRLKQTFEPILRAHPLASLRETIRLIGEARTSTTPEDRRRRELLNTVPGFGRITCATLQADLPELGARDNKAIASLAGVAANAMLKHDKPWSVKPD